MRNASGHQGENERQWKKKWTEGKEMYIKSVLHVQSGFFFFLSFFFLAN